MKGAGWLPARRLQQIAMWEAQGIATNQMPFTGALTADKSLSFILFLLTLNSPVEVFCYLIAKGNMMPLSILWNVKEVKEETEIHCQCCNQKQNHILRECHIDIEGRDSGGIPAYLSYRCASCRGIANFTIWIKSFDIKVNQTFGDD